MGGGAIPGRIIMGGIPGLITFPPPIKGGGTGAADELGGGALQLVLYFTSWLRSSSCEQKRKSMCDTKFQIEHTIH